MKIITHSGKEFDSVDAYQQHTVERIKEKCPEAVIRGPSPARESDDASVPADALS